MTDEMTGDDLRKMGQKWMDRIRAADKREKDWFDAACVAEKAYLADTGATSGKVYDFNILHSNIETIVPAVYNSTPIPDVRERFRTGPVDDQTTVAMQVAQIIERAITVQADDGALETELEDATQDALLSGRGVIRVRFDADEAQPEIDAGDLALHPIVANERLTYEAVSWRDYREGPAKRWQDVPWVAFQHMLPWEEIERIQDPKLKEMLAVGGAGEQVEPDKDADTHIWEIWCRATSKVYMIVRDSGDVLSIIDDPMGLAGFFPCARPVQPIGVAGNRVPVVPFMIYKALAEELEAVTKRIKAVTSGLQVKGFIVGSAADIEALAIEGDNTLIPVANMESFAATGGLEKAIAWWPVDKAIQVLRELYISRDQCKSMIYEVTGISDIVRGQGNANETATAQEIKSQWGSLRIRKLQRMIERCARDIFVISAELICSKFGPETLQKMTGIMVSPEVAAMLGQPLDSYRIDVESDSTVRADLSRRKGEMTEFLSGTAAFFSTMAPVVAQAPQMAGPVAELYASFARQFNLGKQAEDALETMAQFAKQAGGQQGEQPPNPEQMKMQADQAAAQAKMQADQMKMQADMEAKAAELAFKREELAAKTGLEREKLQLEIERLTAEFGLQREKMMADGTNKAAELQIKRDGKGAETMVRVGGNDEGMDTLMQGLSGVLEAVLQGQAATAEAAKDQTEALVAEIQRGNQGVVAAMIAPKQVIRDADGRAVGVQTMLN